MASPKKTVQRCRDAGASMKPASGVALRQMLLPPGRPQATKREVKMGREGEEEGITRAVALGFRHPGPACFLCRGGGGGRVSKCTIYKHN